MNRDHPPTRPLVLPPDCYQPVVAVDMAEPVVGIQTSTLKGVFVLKSVYVEPGKPARLVDVDLHTIQEELGWLSCAYPFPDPSVAVICDDDGIQNRRLPNRTINGELMPGPFYVLATTSSGELYSLSDVFVVPL